MRVLDIAKRQREALRELDHRPWELPQGRWLVAQTWEDSLFAHWRVDADVLRPLVPEELELDEHNGSGWLGVHAFRVACLRVHGTLPVPWISSFSQLNVRTYVRAGRRPGLWFFSLDTPSTLAAETAKLVYRLRWRTCRLELGERDGRLEVSASRPEGQVFAARASARGRAEPAEPGTLEHFLFERYCLYGGDGELQRAELHHRPWLVRPALGGVDLSTIAPIALPTAPAILHAAATQDVLAWPLEQV